MGSIEAVVWIFLGGLVVYLFLQLQKAQRLNPDPTLAKDIEAPETEAAARPAPTRNTPDVKDLLHLTYQDQLPRVFRFAGRTFVFSSHPHPHYTVCATQEDLDERRKEQQS